MKLSFIIVCFLSGFLGCDKTESPSPTLIGTWNYAYQQQTKNADGSWGAWTGVATLVAVPPISFTSNGQILYDGKLSSQCCQYQKFEQQGNQVLLSELVSCPTVRCALCPSWTVEFIDENTLIIEMCTIRHKYNRAK